MEIPDSVIEKVKALRDKQNAIDTHINDDDLENVRRAKDLEFGKTIGMNEICNLLKI